MSDPGERPHDGEDSRDGPMQTRIAMNCERKGHCAERIGEKLANTGMN